MRIRFGNIMSTNRNRYVVVGPLSEPICGQSVVTRQMVAEFGKVGIDPYIIDVSWGSNHKTPAGVLRKMVYSVYAALLLPVVGAFSNLKIYLVIDANAGLYLNLLIAAACSFSSSKFVFHHHAYDYVGTYDWRMASLIKFGGKKAIHVLQCEKLCKEFERRYEVEMNTVALSNAAWIVPGEYLKERNANRPIILGYLSNLTVEKGVLLVLETFKELKAQNIDVSLTIAGGATDCVVEDAVRSVAAEFGDCFTYLGAIYGEEKNQFFKDVDVFLFPTCYMTETEGIVTLESLAVGTPVIAYGRACISENITSGGVLVCPREDFVSVATLQIQAWCGNREALSVASRDAYLRACELNRKAIEALSGFLDGLQAH